MFTFAEIRNAQVVEEIVGGNVQRTYTYGNALISQTQLIGGTWTTSFYGYDGGGSVRLLTDSAGNVTDTWDYDAFGAIIGRTGSTPNNYLYRGEQFDADLGVYFLRARYYDQQRGRFFSMDEFNGFLNEPLSLHKYLYANADPVNFRDPSGFSTLSDYAVKVRAFVVRQVAAIRQLSRQIACVIIKTASEIAQDPLVPIAAGLVELAFCKCQGGSGVGSGIGGRLGGSGGAGGAGGGDIILTRFGKAPETVEKLAADAAAAKAHPKVGIHGVSTTSQPKYPGAPSAPKSEVEKYFPVHKTLGPGHYTVELPEPVTQEVADLFNLIFRGCK